MKTEIKGSVLTVYLEGRIDTNNAAQAEKELFSTIQECDAKKVVLDAEELSYISSAGLRVLMKLKKSLGSDTELVVENVSRDVFDIFETTGFTEILDIRKAYRSISVDGLEVIGRGFFGTVYRYDPETIIKVYKGKDSIPMIENEKRMAKKAFVSGIPTAISYDIVKVGEDYASVFELLNAKTFHDMAAESADTLPFVIGEYVKLLRLVHGTKLKVSELPSYRERFTEYLDVIKRHLSDDQYSGLKRLLLAMPEEGTVIHGDIQMKNVMLVDKEPMLIDMDTLGLGNIVFEFAGLYVTYQEFEEDDPGNAEDFLGISNELVDKIWKLIVDGYFDIRDEVEKGRILDKIRLVAAIRFLYLLESTDLKEGELGKLRISHTVQHIDEILGKVDTLAL